MSDNDEEITRPWGLFTTPEALIAQVIFQFNTQMRAHRDISDNCQVPLGTVTGILAETWGEAEWYDLAESQYGQSSPGRPPMAPEDRADDILHVRVKTSDKEKWIKFAAVAGYESLSKWVIDTLNKI